MFGEGDGDEASAAGVEVAVGDGVGVVDAVDGAADVDPASFDHVCFAIVDVVDGGGGAEGDAVRRGAHNIAVFLVGSLQVEVSVASTHGEDFGVVGQGPYSRSGVFGERVEGEAVDEYANILLLVSCGSRGRSDVLA